MVRLKAATGRSFGGIQKDDVAVAGAPLRLDVLFGGILQPRQVPAVRDLVIGGGIAQVPVDAENLDLVVGSGLGRQLVGDLLQEAKLAPAV